MAKIQYIVTKKEMENIGKAVREIQNIRMFLLAESELKERKLLTQQLWNIMEMLNDVEQT